MISALNNINFIDKCVGLEIEGKKVRACRECDGGKENISTTLPLIIGSQKGLVEESDLKIPNMRGIMMARQKELIVVEPGQIDITSKSVNFEKPKEKAEVKLISSDNLDELINLLHNEAKVI